MSKELTAVLNPDKNEFETMQRQCRTAVVSGLLPAEYTKGSEQQRLAKALVVAMKGRELGIPMMQAFSSIHVIKGKPAMSAELMLALIYRTHPAAIVNFTKLNDQECCISAQRPRGTFTDFKFTIDDARSAGLLSNDVWRKYPRAMLRSRCITEMARTLFPDAILGVSYTPEELGADNLNETEYQLEEDECVAKETEAVPSCFELEEALSDNDSHLESIPQEAYEAVGEYEEDEPETHQSVKNADYVMTTGKYKGSTLESLGYEKLASWVSYMTERDFTKGKDYQAAKVFVETY